MSAFTIFMSMGISFDKLRAFVINWGNEYRESLDYITIHNRGWNPVNVNIKTTGDLKHLGIIWGMDLINNTQLDNAKLLLTKWCKKASSFKLSKTSKKIALEAAIFPKIIFYARFASWTATELGTLDKIISKFIRVLHRCAYGMPEKLLYLSKEYGGLGHKQLSYEIGKAKLALFWRMQSKEGDAKIATLACIGRGFRAAGQPINGRSHAHMADPLNEVDRYWIHSVQEHLKLLNCQLTTQGYTTDHTNAWHGDTLTKDQRISLNLIGIANYGEMLMGNDEDLHVELGIPAPSDEISTSPLALRSGQCWSDGLSVWEIIGWWDNSTISVIEWKNKARQDCNWITPQVGATVYLSEEHFCNGAGTKHCIEVEFFLTWAKLLINLGTEKHLPNGQTTAQIKMMRARTAMNRFQQPTCDMPPWGHINPHYRDIFTDGSWCKSGTPMEYIEDKCRIISGGAIVMEYASSHSAPRYQAIYIQGNIQHSKSAYMMELLSICVAHEIKQHNNGSGYIRSDCKAAINKCKRIWSGKASFRTLPLISLALTRSGKTDKLVHVPSHPERKKADKEWLDSDCGIYAADAAADGTVDFIMCRIDDTEVIRYLTRNLDCIITTKDGILMEDMDDIWNTLRYKEYLNKRDEYRAKDILHPRPPKWSNVNPKLMSRMWGIDHTNNEAIGRAIKSLWDWNHTGSNRIKGNPDADCRCQLCGVLETQAHVIAYCKHPDVKKLRNEMLDDCRDDITLMEKGKALDAAWAIFHLAENKIYMTDLCTGIISPLTKIQLENCVSNLTFTPAEWRPVEKLLRSLGTYGRKVTLLHWNLTAKLLTGDTGIKTGLIKTSAGPQRSIQAAFGWQNTNHSIYCQPTSNKIHEEWTKDDNKPPKVNVHLMIRWNRMKPTMEIPIRVKRKHMGPAMKKLHDLTHETKIVYP